MRLVASAVVVALIGWPSALAAQSGTAQTDKPPASTPPQGPPSSSPYRSLFPPTASPFATPMYGPFSTPLDPQPMPLQHPFASMMQPFPTAQPQFGPMFQSHPQFGPLYQPQFGPFMQPQFAPTPMMQPQCFPMMQPQFAPMPMMQPQCFPMVQPQFAPMPMMQPQYFPTLQPVQAQPQPVPLLPPTRRNRRATSEFWPWSIPSQIDIITNDHAPAPVSGVTPDTHIIGVHDFPSEPKPSEEFKAAVNVTDTGFISGFTLIEGGCDFLDDASPFGGDRCATNTPPADPDWNWPNVMVQVLDLDGIRNSPGRTVEPMHILGEGGPNLLGDGSDGVINDLAPATYDNSVQYELITVRVEIRSAVRNGFNLLREWLLRRPQEILAARSERAPFMDQARSAPSRSTAPSGSKGRARLSMLVTSTGTSTGEAFRVQALANSPIAFDLTSVVAEPLKGVKPNAIAKASSMFGARGAPAATAIGYCLEFMRQPPSAGMLYRIAEPEIQKRFEPMRRVAHAARVLSDAGELKPDSDPKSYAHSIAQWAVWSAEQKFTQSSYTQAFVNHTRKAVEAAGRPWRREFAQQVEEAAPNRWQQIQRILRVAGM